MSLYVTLKYVIGCIFGITAVKTSNPTYSHYLHPKRTPYDVVTNKDEMT